MAQRKLVVKHPGALHRELGVPSDKKIPAKMVAAAAKKGGKLGQRARFAEVLEGKHVDKMHTSKTNHAQHLARTAKEIGG